MSYCDHTRAITRRKRKKKFINYRRQKIYQYLVTDPLSGLEENLSEHLSTVICRNQLFLVTLMLILYTSRFNFFTLTPLHADTLKLNGVSSRRISVSARCVGVSASCKISLNMISLIYASVWQRRNQPPHNNLWALPFLAHTKLSYVSLSYLWWDGMTSQRCHTRGCRIYKLKIQQKLHVNPWNVTT